MYVFFLGFYPDSKVQILKGPHKQLYGKVIFLCTSYIYFYFPLSKAKLLRNAKNDKASNICQTLVIEDYICSFHHSRLDNIRG